MSIDEVYEEIQTTSHTGLTQAEAEKRLEQYGHNQLPQPPRKSILQILFNQFNDVLIYILIFAAVITLILAFVNNSGNFSIEYFFDTIVIVVVLIINAMIGMYQELKAEVAVNSLRKLVSEESLVLRNGEITIVETKYLVPGDVVLIRAGERVPADMRIIEGNNLKIDESALTGESMASSKAPVHSVPVNTPIGDRQNMAYMGTIVETGTGKGIIIQTGIDTEVGKISKMVSEIDSITTPLQEKLEQFSGFLAKIIIIVSVLLIFFGLLVEMLFTPSLDLLDSFLGLTIVGVSLAVAAIPEGLPIILTFALAISVQKMAKKNAVIRKLQAVETLGSLTFIATDKTGTLTLNELTLVQLVSFSNTVKISDNDTDISPDDIQILLEHMKATTLPLDQLDFSQNTERAIADPLDMAIYRHVNQLQSSVISIDQMVTEYPFDSTRKMMSVILQHNTDYRIYTKGAPDVVLGNSKFFVDADGEIKELTENYQEIISTKLNQLADEGYRIIGTGYRDIVTLPESSEAEVIENNLIFIGFLVLIDPPREEVFDALRSCYNAGISVTMITGDHPQTAKTIAKQLGIFKKGDQVLTGVEIDHLTDEELIDQISTTPVFARVSPTHKLRLVTLIRDEGEIVGMTGDGINDSPALVKADVGVAMGKTGTDAAKEAADMILLDDNFATLVSAVEEGRAVKQNIRKFTNYLLASNASEVLFLLLGFFTVAMINPSLVQEFVPLSETQILYLNLVTDSFLALALGLEAKERSIMKQDPMNPDLPIVTRPDAIKIIFIGTLVSVSALIIFLFLLGPTANWINLDHGDVAYVQSFSLTFLVLSELFIALSYRSTEPIIQVGFFRNRYFVLSTIAVIAAHIAIINIPILNKLFDTAPLSIIDWIIISILSVIVFIIMEVFKIKQLTNRD